MTECSSGAGVTTTDLEDGSKAFVGEAAALVSAGIVQSGWFPGLTGNNKIMQTVFIRKDDEPKKLVGNRGGGLLGPWAVRIRIEKRRASGQHVYCVVKESAVLAWERGERDPFLGISITDRERDYFGRPATYYGADSESLIAAGIVERDWLPANIQVRQIVLLEKPPRLVRGHFRGERAKHPYLIIWKRGRDYFEVCRSGSQQPCLADVRAFRDWCKELRGAA